MLKFIKLYTRNNQCMFIKRYKMRALRNSTVDSIPVSRHLSWPGPKCGLDGSCVQAEDVHPSFVRLMGHCHSLTFFFLVLDWSWREHHGAEV